MLDLVCYYTNVFYLIDATSSALHIGPLRDVAGNLIIYRGADHLWKTLEGMKATNNALAESRPGKGVRIFNHKEQCLY